MRDILELPPPWPMPAFIAWFVVASFLCTPNYLGRLQHLIPNAFLRFAALGGVLVFVFVLIYLLHWVLRTLWWRSSLFRRFEQSLLKAEARGPRRSNKDLIAANLHDEDLTGAFLFGANLDSAVLVGATLNDANLEGANLRHAFLDNAKLVHACLRNANLLAAWMSDADLRRANLNGANLTSTHMKGANLTEAVMRGTIFQDTFLRGCDFTNATIDGATFADVDLSGVTGLDSVHHDGPSTIGLDTIFRSGGKIPFSFLQRAGVPDRLLKDLGTRQPGVNQYHHSCFISYSSLDIDFARQLYTDLQSNGVVCWFAPEDIKIGDRFRQRIDDAIHNLDRLLVVLSQNSIHSAWVEKEVEKAFEEERIRKKTILFPVRLDDLVMRTAESWAADIRRTRHIGDFTNWKNPAQYQTGLQRLLRDLAEEAGKAAE